MDEHCHALRRIWDWAEVLQSNGVLLEGHLVALGEMCRDVREAHTKAMEDDDDPASEPPSAEEDEEWVEREDVDRRSPPPLLSPPNAGEEEEEDDENEGNEENEDYPASEPEDEDEMEEDSFDSIRAGLAYDSCDDYDEFLIKDAEDREALMRKSDLERETILADRFDRVTKRNEQYSILGLPPHRAYVRCSSNPYRHTSHSASILYPWDQMESTERRAHWGNAFALAAGPRNDGYPSGGLQVEIPQKKDTCMYICPGSSLLGNVYTVIGIDDKDGIVKDVLSWDIKILPMEWLRVLTLY